MINGSFPVRGRPHYTNSRIPVSHKQKEQQSQSDHSKANRTRDTRILKAAVEKRQNTFDGAAVKQTAPCPETVTARGAWGPVSPNETATIELCPAKYFQEGR